MLGLLKIDEIPAVVVQYHFTDDRMIFFFICHHLYLLSLFRSLSNMCAKSVFSSRSYLCCGFEDYPTLSFCGFQETLLHCLLVKTVANRLCPLSLNLVRSNTCRLTYLLIKYLSLNLSFDPRESVLL